MSQRSRLKSCHYLSRRRLPITLGALITLLLFLHHGPSSDWETETGPETLEEPTNLETGSGLKVLEERTDLKAEIGLKVLEEKKDPVPDLGPRVLEESMSDTDSKTLEDKKDLMSDTESKIVEDRKDPMPETDSRVLEDKSDPGLDTDSKVLEDLNKNLAKEEAISDKKLVEKVEMEPLEPKSTDTQTFKMEHCNCERTLKSSKWESEGVNYTDTTCGKDAFRRGKGQKIVGFSFYGDIATDHAKYKGYFEGIVGNLELLPKFYPGWIMRVYYDMEDGHPVLKDLCELACKNDLLDICHAGKLPGTPLVDARKVFAMNWRFFPTLDPQVDTFVCRDLDSRFSQREFDAVAEWLVSDKAIHSMRDHYGHLIAMLGAAWGSNMLIGDTRQNWKQAWERILKDPICYAGRDKSGPDQQILTRYVWPWGRDSAFQHDAFYCKMFKGSVPFPTQRLDNTPNNFIASVVNTNFILERKCPIYCRPKDHQDWEFC